jgi:predicted ester cyclase
MMTPDALVRAWFHEVWDLGDESAIDRFMAADAKVHGLSGPDGPTVMIGPAHFKPFFRTMRAALGDLEVTVDRTIVQGDMVAAHCHVIARHVGDALGGPPTGRPVEFWGVTIARVANGKLVEGWNVFDFLSMYQQLGWVKAPVAP